MKKDYATLKAEAISRRQYARFIAMELDYINDWEWDREFEIHLIRSSYYKLIDKAKNWN